MITHYAFPGIGELPSMSPFCAKIDIYLRMRGLDFELVPSDARKAPKGKLPVIRVEGETIADSQLIIEHLEASFVPPKYSAPLDLDQPASERAEGHLMRRTIEEALYFGMLYSRWVDPQGWAQFRPLLLRHVPKFIGPLIAPLVRRSVGKSAYAQGTARHSAEEVYRLARADLDALATVLGERPYALGETLRSVDASLYSFCAAILYAPLSNPLQTHLQSKANLVAYCDRLRTRFYA